MLDSIKLKSSGNYLFNKLAKCVEQNNRPECLGGIISRLAWLGYNDRNVSAEEGRDLVFGPETASQAAQEAPSPYAWTFEHDPWIS